MKNKLPLSYSEYVKKQSNNNFLLRGVFVIIADTKKFVTLCNKERCITLPTKGMIRDDNAIVGTFHKQKITLIKTVDGYAVA